MHLPQFTGVGVGVGEGSLSGSLGSLVSTPQLSHLLQEREPHTTQPLGENRVPHSGPLERQGEAESCPQKLTAALPSLNPVSLAGGLARDPTP